MQKAISSSGIIQVFAHSSADRLETDKDIISYHNNFIIFMRNKLYRWKEQGLYIEDDVYYEQSPYGYVYVDNVTCRNPSSLPNRSIRHWLTKICTAPSGTQSNAHHANFHLPIKQG